MLENIIIGLHLVGQPSTLIAIVLGSLFGFVVGALPGLTATMAVALLVPVTFSLSPVAAIATIVSAAAMAIAAGDVPNTLLRMPGTPASAAYVEDSFAFTKQGRAAYVLAHSAIFSTIGGIVGTLVFTLASPVLAEFALQFSTFEFFWLGMLGLSCAVFAGDSDTLKSLISTFLGLFIAVVGMDISTGYPRFTFGSTYLLSGIPFIPILIGMFALPEIFRSMVAVSHGFQVESRSPLGAFKDTLKNVVKYKGLCARSVSLGTVIGALPGAGADIAAWISVAVARKTTKKPETWGRGNIESIIAGASSNNAALGGAWIPALVFGIPGDTITAIAIGILYLKGMNPGPDIFLHHAGEVYAVFIIFALANLLLLPFGLMAISMSKFLLAMNRRYLMPLLLVIATVGAYAMDNTVSGIVVMLIFGVIAYFMEAAKLPLAPLILGLVIGPIVEQNLIRSLISANGNVISLVDRPITMVLAFLTILMWLYPVFRKLLVKVSGMRSSA